MSQIKFNPNLNPCSYSSNYGPHESLFQQWWCTTRVCKEIGQSDRYQINREGERERDDTDIRVHTHGASHQNSQFVASI